MWQVTLAAYLPREWDLYEAAQEQQISWRALVRYMYTDLWDNSQATVSDHWVTLVANIDHKISMPYPAQIQ